MKPNGALRKPPHSPRCEALSDRRTHRKLLFFTAPDPSEHAPHCPLVDGGGKVNWKQRSQQPAAKVENRSYIIRSSYFSVRSLTRGSSCSSEHFVPFFQVGDALASTDIDENFTIVIAVVIEIISTELFVVWQVWKNTRVGWTISPNPRVWNKKNTSQNGLE